MRWRNTETPTFAGAGGSAPAIVEALEAVDHDGNVIMAITKEVGGNVSQTLDGVAVGLLRTTTTVDATVGTKQALLSAVPAGKVRIVTEVVLRNASASLAAMSDAVSFGFDASCLYFGSPNQATIAAMTDNTFYTHLTAAYVENTTFTPGLRGAAGDVFGVIFADTNISATLDIDVFYYDIDA